VSLEAGMNSCIIDELVLYIVIVKFHKCRGQLKHYHFVSRHINTEDPWIYNQIKRIEMQL
jgi:hypothetical protein